MSTVILNVYQGTGIANGDGSRRSLEKHGKLDDIRRFSTKKFGEDHDMHHNMALAENYSKPTKRGEYQYVSGVMGISYNPFLNPEAGDALMNFEVAEYSYMNFEVAELLKFGTEKIVEIDQTESERPSRSAT